MRLDGKVIVVTGAAQGIGQAMVRLFTQQGARVIAGDRNAEALATTVAEVRSSGGQISGVVGDISVRAQAEAIVDGAVAHYGQIDGLVNNAGVVDRFQAIDALEDEVWNRVLGINLNGTMYATRRAVQLMLKGRGGSIVNISSFAATSGAVSGVAYAASKHAVLGLTRNTAWQFMHRNIRCNAILPGGVDTGMGATIESDKVDTVALGRISPLMALMPPMMPAKEVAQMALFLVSDEASHVNGAMIPVDAGLRAV
jgi:NAD(P)-dependent dehydrogenase (short-subunit alcohol dehydrogenase family)